MEKKIKRNNKIDVIRGLCILAVILLHLNIHFGYSNTFLKELLPSKWFSLLFWSGFYGVIVFFTLSGYLITSSILKKWGKLSKIDIKTFYWLRFSRIIPALTVLLIILSILHLTNVSGFVINSEQTSLARAILSALTFHTNLLEIQVGYLPANWDILWSISIEETFYLLFPLVCLFLKREWHLVIVLIIFLIVSPWARTHLYLGNELADRNHLAYIDSIVLGCMTAIIAARFSYRKWINWLLFAVGISMIILIVFFKAFVYKNGLIDSGLNITILSIGVSLVVLCLHKKDNTEKAKNRWQFNWIKNMGMYSYEIYLSHMFVIIFGAQIFQHFELGPNWLVPTSLLIILISYQLGKFIFKFFSEPLNLWLRKKWNGRGNNIVKLNK
jgi:peptidoglycan/LPS O-acetylase OafA/YrhL